EGDARVRRALLPFLDQATQRFREPERVERDRSEARNEAVHRIVQARGFLRDHVRSFARRLRVLLAPEYRDRERADRRDRLCELIVQLTRDRAAFLVQTLLDELRQLAPFCEPRFGIARLELGLPLALDRGGHAVEGGADEGSFGSREGRQTIGELAVLDTLETRSDDGQWRERTAHQPEHEHVQERERDTADPEQLHEVVPSVEDSARSI